MRAIDADALMKDVRENSESYFADDFAEFWVNRQPTIQSEIVRCGECTYHYQRNCPIEKYFSLDGFCSRGKRREVTNA